MLGTYDPVAKTDPTAVPGAKPYKDIKLDTARAKYWLGVGAQPSDPACRLLSMLGLIEPRFHVQKMRALGGAAVGGLKEEEADAGKEREEEVYIEDER